MELYIDIGWLLDRQEDILGEGLAVLDYSALVAAVARHRVDTPSADVTAPDACWRAAALLETIVLQRPLPDRNELYGHGVAASYLAASGAHIDAFTEQWLDLVDDIRALRVSVHNIADRLRSHCSCAPVTTHGRAAVLGNPVC